MKKETNNAQAYESPEIEVIKVILNRSILEGSGDGNVDGPDDEIPS